MIRHVIIPKYALNTRLDWRVLPTLDLYAGATVYGRQKPDRPDFQSLPVTGEEAREMKPCAIAGPGGRYTLNRRLALNFGVRNVFDKRICRKGNAVGVNNPRTIHGAGAYTCNEPGRPFHVSLNRQFRSAPAARIVAVANSSVGTIDALRTAP